MARGTTRLKRLDDIDLQPGRKIGPRYVVERLLGYGYEGEVYQIREVPTGIRRAAKLYYPHRNPKDRSSIRHAQKLNSLRHCPIVLQFHHFEQITIKKQRVGCLISELCSGMPLEHWIKQHTGKRIRPFRALMVLYHLARGIEAIHALREYHADVHTENILIQPIGVRFELKLIDFYDWGRMTRYKQQMDILDTVRVFYDCLGGAKHYSAQPPEVRYICAGLKRGLILSRFPTMSALRQHLEQFEWRSTLA